MADELFTIGAAFGVQSAFGTVNATVRDLAGAIGVTDGIVLGDRESGDAESGITIPDLERVFREVADVGLTKQHSTRIRDAINGFAIAFQLKGNGSASTPLAGEGKPDAGIDALLQAAGLVGANGTAPVYAYTPGSTAVYLTAKLWLGDLSFVFQDCLADLEIPFTGGEIGVASAAIAAGSITVAADGVTFPTFTYGNQSSLSAPNVEAVGHAWGTTRPFSDLTLSIANAIEDIPDSNAATGIRKDQTGRIITATGTIWVDTADSDFAYQEAIKTVAPTAEESFQVGTIAGPAATLNAYLVSLSNPGTHRVKYDRLGGQLVATVELRAEDPVAGGEFTLTYN